MQPSLPINLVKWLDEWGPKLKARVELAIDEVKQSLGCFPAPSYHPHLLVGTDCSGIEAPIHALRQLQIPHTHCWSSELAEAPRAVLMTNTPPVGQVYENVLDQGSEVHGPRFIHLYLSGFSCKPFSMLHHGTRLLEEPEADVFRAVVQRLRTVRPPLYILENVVGISRGQDAVVEELESGGLYNVITQQMDPCELAEPVRRPRLYFFGVRHDVAVGDPSLLQQVVSKTWQAVRQSAGQTPSAPLEQRLLPPCHPAVMGSQSLQKQRWQKALS